MRRSKSLGMQMLLALALLAVLGAAVTAQPPAGGSSAPAGSAPAGAAPAAAPASSGAQPPGGGAVLFPILLFFIFFGCIAVLYTEGLWGNAIRVINVTTAALLATNFWEPTARFLEEQSQSFTYYWDFVALWGLFAIFIVIFRVATDMLSRVKVKFLKIVDQVGSVFFAGWVAWILVCFSAFTFHTAPLARNFMFGGFDPDARMLMGLAPDRQWLGFVQKVSMGAFSRTLNDADAQQGAYGQESGDLGKLAVFDRNGEFIPKYAARRSALEKNVAEKSSTRVDSGAPKR